MTSTDSSDTGSPRYLVEFGESVSYGFVEGFFMGMDSIEMEEMLPFRSAVVTGDVDMIESLTDFPEFEHVKKEVQH